MSQHIENSEDKRKYLDCDKKSEDENWYVDSEDEEFLYPEEKEITKTILEIKFRNLKKISQKWNIERYWRKVYDCFGIDIKSIIKVFNNNIEKGIWLCDKCKFVIIKQIVEEYFEIQEEMTRSE